MITKQMFSFDALIWGAYLDKPEDFIISIKGGTGGPRAISSYKAGDELQGPGHMTVFVPTAKQGTSEPQ